MVYMVYCFDCFLGRKHKNENEKNMEKLKNPQLDSYECSTRANVREYKSVFILKHRKHWAFAQKQMLVESILILLYGIEGLV